ncbi:SRPBCC family protein [Variovorax robiniae]|uniref:SRPBCC family protein n=1 Tax=Variovorax robiniae TaxID=1836199 RepID=A0ABU8X5I9_9BURK
MKVSLEKTFPMPGSADAAWTVLQDIDAVAGCMPGAKITERIDATHFKGTVAVKFGPANMAFRGDVEILSLDAASKTLRLMGKGTDSTGSSGASMDLTARIDAIDAASSQLVGTSEVAMSGKAAAFGGRMMDSVADQVLKQFAANFAKRVSAVQEAAATAAPAESTVIPVAANDSTGALATPGTVASATTATASTSAASGATASAHSAARPDAPVPNPSASALSAATAAQVTRAATATSAPAPTASPAPTEPAQLNATSLLWGAFKDWLHSLFAAKRT